MKIEECRREQTTRVERLSTARRGVFKVGLSGQFKINPRSLPTMKPSLVFASIFVAMLLGRTAQAQTGTGFPPLPSIPLTPPLQNQPNATHFWFIVAGDNRPAKASLPQPQTPSQIFTDAQRFKPAFFLWSGDTIYGHKVDRKTLQRQYQEFFKIAHLAKVPVFNSPGNHEMDTSTETANGWAEAPDPRLESIYLEMMQFPKNAPPYGAFDYGNSRFIAVDTEEVTRANPTATPSPTPPGGGMSLDPGYVSQVQFDLLKQDLDANQTKAHIFVFMHHPIMPSNSSSGLNAADAGALQALFQKYPNVSYVIAAHEHLYFNATGTTLAPADRKDPSTAGPSYLVSGGAGAPLGYCPGAVANCQSFHHYLAFEVDGDTVKVQVVPVTSPTGKKARK
jgi:calcineurin-like phosphoesterase family protein